MWCNCTWIRVGEPNVYSLPSSEAGQRAWYYRCFGAIGKFDVQLTVCCHDAFNASD